MTNSVAASLPGKLISVLPGLRRWNEQRIIRREATEAWSKSQIEKGFCDECYVEKAQAGFSNCESCMYHGMAQP